jgi:hypothetical protein
MPLICDNVAKNFLDWKEDNVITVSTEILFFFNGTASPFCSNHTEWRQSVKYTTYILHITAHVLAR